jgi:hypothetical protein
VAPQVVLCALVRIVDAMAATVSPPVNVEWIWEGEYDADVTPIVARIEELRTQGLMGRHVTSHFLKLSIAPAAILSRVAVRGHG